MKLDIIIAGVGGQGIVSIAAAIGLAAVETGLFLKQSEVHGMSQRGGEVQSHLRISDKQIASDLIPEGKADIIISVEPMESLRYLNMLKPDGWVITNTKPYVNIPDYPDINKIILEIESLKNHIALDAEKFASELGSDKSANMIILGAASPFINIDAAIIENAILNLFKTKGEKIVTTNLAAFKLGRKYTEEKSKIKI